MLSFNTKNILDRIRDRIYSKQDKIGRGGPCTVLTQEQLLEKTNHYNTSTNKDALSASEFLKAESEHLITSSNATNSSYIPAYFQSLAEYYASLDSDQPYQNENIIENHVAPMQQINDQLGFDIGHPVTGSIFHWAKSGVHMFNTFQKDSILDTNAGFYSTTDKNGKRILLPNVNASVQMYRKRLRGEGDRDENGVLLGLESYEEGTMKFLNQKMAHEWEGILTEVVEKKDGTKTFKQRDYISDEELWEKYLNNPDLKLHDEYDGEGNLIRQVPKQIVQSLHANIDGKEIRDAIKELSKREDIGTLWSKNDKERKEILDSLKPLKEDGTVDEESFANKGAKYRVFVEMLENREYPRTLSNSLSVVMNGREETHKYLRVMYDGMARNKLTVGTHGIDMDLTRTNMGRNALVSEVSKMMVAREMWKEKYGKEVEPTLEDLSSVLSVGISIKGVHVRPTSKSPSFIQGVESTVYDGFQASLKNKARDLNGVENYELDGKGEYIKGKEGKITKAFLKEEFGISVFQGLPGKGLKKKIIEGGNVVISEKPNVTLNQRIKSMIPEELKSEMDTETLDLQVGQIKEYIAKYALAQYGGGKDPKLQQKKRDKALEMRKLLSQQTGKTEMHDQWYSKYKSIASKFHRSMDADSSFSSDELDPESNNAGLFNKALDVFTALQVVKKENGATPSSGGSAFMFQNHHIYGKGDNQANTHFADVFTPAHQGGLHATNYLIEDYETSLENLSMMKQYISNYEKNRGAGTKFNIPPEMVESIKSLTPETLKLKYNDDGKLKPGEEVPVFTIVPMVKGDATKVKREGFKLHEPDIIVDGELRSGEELSMEDIHTNFMYPPMSNEILSKHDDTTIRSGDRLISLWGNESEVPQHAGTILGESREVMIEDEEGNLVPTYITPPHPLWSLNPNELNV